MKEIGKNEAATKVERELIMKNINLLTLNISTKLTILNLVLSLILPALTAEAQTPWPTPTTLTLMLKCQTKFLLQ